LTYTSTLSHFSFAEQQDGQNLLKDLAPQTILAGNSSVEKNKQTSITEHAGQQDSVMVVLNKADLCPAGTSTTASNMRSILGRVNAHRISCTTGEGLAQLETAISTAVQRLLNPEDSAAESSGTHSGRPSGSAAANVGSTMITRERHRRHVKLCVGHLERFLTGRLPMDAAAEEIR
jgi:tRNA U34 5-carboxymethylaminomethyl modifying GTPase MnmE/TrmE